MIRIKDGLRSNWYGTGLRLNVELLSQCMEYTVESLNFRYSSRSDTLTHYEMYVGEKRDIAKLIKPIFGTNSS